MGQNPSSGGAESPEEARSGLSQFAARILGQLSLSAWLPAALLTLAGTTLIQFHLQETLNVSTALEQARKAGWALVLLTVPVLVVVTLVTQAFSFEAIRLLEGYWHRPGPAAWLRSGMIRFHGWRKGRLQRKRLEARRDAFATARPRLLLGKTDPAVVDALERQAIGAKAPPHVVLSDSQNRALKALQWWYLCDAHLFARAERLSDLVADYPKRDSRTMPTKLGNVIRAAEDGLKNTGGDLEGFAHRNRHLVSARVQEQHDQFRTRLDMYCTLVLVAALLTVASPVFLLGKVVEHGYGWGVIGITSGFALLCASSYYAAVASARGYAVTLRQMDRAKGDADRTSGAPSPPSGASPSNTPGP